MKIKYGDMWDAWESSDLFVITTNSFLKSLGGDLVMGRGIARQARDTFPGLDEALGEAIMYECGHLGEYRLLVSPLWKTGRKLAAFQVKRDFDGNADPSLIKNAAFELEIFARKNPDAEIHMNFPGIGNGRLTAETVLPLIKDLPDNVTVWRYKK